MNAPQVQIVAKTNDDADGDKKLDKIAKLRMQSKARKITQAVEKEMLEDDSESEERSNEENGGDFFTAKCKGEESESEDNINLLPSLSKRKMRKIKEDGPFAGKNVLIFDSQGKPQPKSTVVKNDSKNYFESLRKNQIQGEDVLML
jgi:hypothetical protein